MRSPRLVVALTGCLSLHAALASGFPEPMPDGCFWGTPGVVNACLVPTGALLGALERRGGERMRWVPAAGVGGALPVEEELLRAPEVPGIWRLEAEGEDGAWRPRGREVITQVRFDGASKRLNGYLIGTHPGLGRGGSYKPPEWFIEVTPENQDYSISPNFRLRQFLTKDQAEVWPKYLPLSPLLVEKLERVVEELRREGFAARRVHVMSGYRTPNYNGPGGKGRAKYSRHTYGDAADVWVDDDGDGKMDDLNRDGRVDDLDAEYLVTLVDRVERAFPELAGGAGIYRANRVRGPFAHIDVRGRPARWSKR